MQKFTATARTAKPHYFIFFPIAISITMTLFTSSFTIGDHQQEPSKSLMDYSIRVIIQALPFYAIDDAGNPVYDLKKEEIEFYLNRKKTPFLGVFSAKTLYPSPASGKAKNKQMKMSQGASTGIEPGQADRDRPPTPERYILIILDTIFNSPRGITQSQKILREIIQNSASGDAIVLLTLDKHKGLFYQTGPTKDRKKLLKFINQASLWNAAKISVSNTAEQILRKNRAFSKRRAAVRYSSAQIKGTGNMKEYAILLAAKQELKAEQARYKNKGKVFANSITSLKYALQSITRPKLIYLVSEGRRFPYISEHRIKRTAEAINRGGSMFFIMDSSLIPTSPLARTGKDLLKDLTEASGGRYFGGWDHQKIAAELKKSTSAYYELMFSQEKIKNSTKGIRVDIRCKRKGVKIISMNRTEFKVPYRELPKRRKELFALNVVQKGSWSRMVAKIRQTVHFRTISNCWNSRKIELFLPPEMNERQLDLFLLTVDPLSAESDITYRKMVVSDKLVLEIPIQKKRNSYFVIIDPEGPICLYGRI